MCCSPRGHRVSIRSIDLHTRKLRCFLVAAEELHFSRAAARLFLTQQALSRQIKELETELGVPLFERTTRKVALTPAGAAFHDAARAIVAELDDAVATARRANRALTGKLTLGFIPGAALELTAPILAAYRERYPDVEIELREFPANDPSAGLASGVTDIAFIRLPQGTRRIETETVFEEPVIALVAEGHRLAVRDSVSVRDLLGEPMTLSNTGDEVYRAFWGLQDARDPGVPVRFLPVGSITEEVSLVAAGAAICVTGAAIQTYAAMPGVRFLRIDDWPASILALGWHAGERSRVVASFADTVREVRDREPGIIEQIANRGVVGSARP